MHVRNRAGGAICYLLHARWASALVACAVMRVCCVQDVTLAIYESVLPRSAHDAVPRSRAGVLASAADKLDALVGLAAAGCLPTASADRYGLRRITYGLLQTLISNGVRGSMRGAVAAAAEVQPLDAGEGVQRDIVEFVTRRLEQLILDDGAPHSRCCDCLRQGHHVFCCAVGPRGPRSISSCCSACTCQ